MDFSLYDLEEFNIDSIFNENEGMLYDENIPASIDFMENESNQYDDNINGELSKNKSEYSEANNLNNSNGFVSLIYPTETKVPRNPFAKTNYQQKRNKKLSKVKKKSKLKSKNNQLTEYQENFKNQYYSVFLSDVKGKSVLKKELVLKIHQNIYQKLRIDPVKRINRRCVFSYFRDFAPDSEKILNYITEHKEHLSKLIKLSEIKSKNHSTKDF